MRKYGYSLTAAFAAFIVGASSAAFWVYSDTFFFEPVPEVETPIVSNSTNINPPPKDIADSTAVSTKSRPLPCSSADAMPSKPWAHTVEVLASFPPDSPPLKYIGTFRDKDWNYMLDLYQDSKGIFGEISSPVLEADSPTSRLYGVIYDPAKKIIQFRAFGMEFTGVVATNAVKGKMIRIDRTETVTLRRLKTGPEFYGSRAEFDCAMTLFGRS